MCIIDDPMLALIARFVVEDLDDISLSDELYLRQQVAEIKNHIKDAPREKQQQLTLTWIEEYAERFRREWQRKTIKNIALKKRCADCPLIDDDAKPVCSIHRQWVALLEEYITSEIASDKYVEETLNLLNEHKTKLKISSIASKMQSRQQ